MEITSQSIYKAFIRVVKSISNAEANYMGFGAENIIKEPIIYASGKDEVKEFLKNKYPQFFPNGKVYERESKDVAQFFYVVIYPLFQWEINKINEGPWKCSQCGQEYENKYLYKPRIDTRLLGDELMFCHPDTGADCIENYKKEKFAHVEFRDDLNYVNKDSPNYIYKITNKINGKSYVGKTRNEPFFRWWNHLSKSNSPFGLELRNSVLSDWSFEVLEVLPPNLEDTEVFRIESEYMIKFNTIRDGYNTVISNKTAITEEYRNPNQTKLF